MIRSHLARDKALAILSMYNINEPPVSVSEIASHLGFSVVPFNFPDYISAVIRIEDKRKIIGVNESHPKTRQRFSIAHELGHYVSGHEDFSHRKRTFIDPEKRFLDLSYRDEREADEFAAELLMPEFMLRKDVLEEHLDTPTLARRYGVSEQAMWIQLINLKLATYQSKSNL